MQIFSQSQTHSYQCRKKLLHSAGFTLVELLVSIGIIVMVTGIVLVKYSSFDSTVLLKSAAYEVALSLRDAQVKSVSALRGANDSFDYPYGMTFTKGSNNYVMFKYSSSTDPDPYYDILATDPLPVYASGVSTTTLGHSLQIVGLCIIKNGNPHANPHCDIDRLDISFKRPEFEAIIQTLRISGSQVYKTGNGNTNRVEAAQIKLKSDTGTSVYVVEVSKLGQVMVFKE